MISEAYLIDCMAYMAKFPNKHFDLAIVDPEYGIDIANRNGSIGQKKGQGIITNYKKNNWDKKPAGADYFRELFRVSKEQIIWGANYFAPHLPGSKGWIVWDKRQPEGVTFAMAELAFTSINKSTKIFSCSRALIGNKVANNKAAAMAQRKIHPAQKPIALYKWALHNYAQRGWTIIDTHMGSQTLRIACHEMGFDFYGCEIDSGIFTDGSNYYNLHTQQQSLFNRD